MAESANGRKSAQGQVLQFFCAVTLTLSASVASAGGILTTLHSFQALDGSSPVSSLVEGPDGFFYGTTEEGGANNVGSVFKISSTGTLTNLYSFTGGDDGATVQAGLVLGSDGNFYGTTRLGGTNGNGTVFKISTNGTLTDVYSFGGGSDGSDPAAGLVQGGDGSFYGTTENGGANSDGTVFKIGTNGTLTTLYAFGYVSNTFGNAIDGAHPEAALVQGSDGQFYGTTYEGGTNNSGTVFKISSAGSLTSLYSFTNRSDGNHPIAALVQGHDGYFYGTTRDGGTNGGLGSVFKINTDGAVTALHQFTGGSDGGDLYAGLVQGSDGFFYGTTKQGGTNNNGTVFRINADGTLTSLFSFTGGDDGAGPAAALVQGTDGFFYGTTQGGGASGAGTVFKISAGLDFVQFTANPANGGVPLTVNFTSRNVDSAGNAISYRNWAFGDGSTSTAQNPPHTYTNAGIFFPVLTATNSLGFAVSGYGDASIVVTPSIAISIQTSNQIVSNATFTVTGTANDYVSVAGVYYQLNGGSWTLASTTNLWTNWTAAVTLFPGTNIIAAFALNISGQFSATNTLSLVYVVTSPLALFIAGMGSVSGITNGSLLQVGYSYTITATAAPGSVFINWTGGANGPPIVLTNGTTLDFIMVTNLVLLAIFEAQPGIAGVTLSGANLVINGNNGQSGITYYVLMSTNVALPLSQWMPIATNVLSASGNFTITVTNTVSPTDPQRFYILQEQ